ncbi:MAG: hypothetical protein Q9167_000946 [Letrouitia subvulpina]
MDPNAQDGTPALSEGTSSLCTADWTSPDDQSPISPGTSVSPTYHRRSFSRLGPVIEEDTAYPGAGIGETTPDLAVDHGLGIKYIKSLSGQALSRRALLVKGGGITIAEMSMRSWVLQPGTMITHWQTLRYAAITFLGVLALLATIIAMLYTTASDALGIYHNYMQYLGSWSQQIARNNGSDELAKRPGPIAMLYDNTTVVGSWLPAEAMAEVSQKHSTPHFSRVVNNVTAAMPHAGVFAAARDPINRIMQPQDFKYGRRHPVFPKLPSKYNSVLNGSGAFIDSIYLLTTSADDTYTLCSLRASLTKDCSTKYNASMGGGVLSTHCSKDDKIFSYGKSEPLATNGVINSDWANVATDWALALSLNAGINEGNASNARMLSQFIPSKPTLEASLPSITEALAVLSGCTLLISAIDSPFKHFWNHSSVTLAEPELESFEAIVRTQDYSSGGTDPWQNVFHLVLFSTFGLNFICLIYKLPKRMITDFIDPQNMFSLSMNSSASQALEGACGGGPEKEQLGLSWFINCDAERHHFFIHEGGGK